MKNKTTAALLALFLGGIGIHRFYLDKGVSGIFYLLFCWTFVPAFIAFIEALLLFTMNEEEFNIYYNYKELKKGKEIASLNKLKTHLYTLMYQIS